MNDLNEIDYKMIQTVFEYLTKNKQSWIGNLLIENCYDRLMLYNKQLSVCNAIKQKNPKGITVNKHSTRKELTLEVFDVKQALYLYYKNNGLTVDVALFDYYITKLNKMKEDTFYLEAQQILERAIPLSIDLFKLGIKAEQLTKIDVDIKAYRKLQLNLEFAQENDSANNKTITLKIKLCKEMFKVDLDVAISIIKGNSTDFVVGYFIARQRLAKPGSRKKNKMTISGTITDAITGEVLVGVKVDTGMKHIIVYTDKYGKYLVKIFKKDADNIVFSLGEKYMKEILPIPTKYKKNKLLINAKLFEIKLNSESNERSEGENV